MVILGMSGDQSETALTYIILYGYTDYILLECKVTKERITVGFDNVTSGNNHDG